ncbi:hypothetical protein [Pseudonocardia alni]|uniref:Uncharacterized protein n=1 Tax=Pseudonocardia alni TaxID=33907 RepID=A0A852VTN5_PSEA5|nr:hypothetical protein [Pseudonocardia antarctica]NYG00348.1 hypothetical protein [Pseudonocardia antarctica]
MTGPDGIRAAIADVLHAAPADRGFPPDRPDECERCGAADGEALAVMLDPATNGTARAHRGCGEAAGWVLAPACTGAPDLCGAGPGELCSPGCPSLAADPGGLR